MNKFEFFETGSVQSSYGGQYSYKCLTNNGEVIFSGILNSQKDEIIKILIQNDLKLLDVSTRKDWACISAQKNSDPTQA